MASQRTGTQILDYARNLAGDNDSSNYGVSASFALDMLNDILLVWSDSIHNRANRISATTSGLTFTAGQVVKTVTAGVDMAAITSAHQSSSASINTPLSPPIEHIKPEEMSALIDDDGTGTAASTRQSSQDWQYWSYEKTADEQDQFRVSVWPPRNATTYMTLVAPVRLSIAAIGNTPDVSPVHAYYISRILGWEIARYNEMPDQWCDRIVSRVPPEIMQPFLGRAVRVSQQQGYIREVEG